MDYDEIKKFVEDLRAYWTQDPLSLYAADVMEALNKENKRLIKQACMNDTERRDYGRQLARDVALEEAIRACKSISDGFLSPEYAAGQPVASFAERFACGKCIEAIQRIVQRGQKDY